MPSVAIKTRAPVDCCPRLRFFRSSPGTFFRPKLRLKRSTRLKGGKWSQDLSIRCGCLLRLQHSRLRQCWALALGIRQAQDPVADRDSRKHSVDEMGRRTRHASTAAEIQTHRACMNREPAGPSRSQRRRYEEMATIEELAKLTLHKPGNVPVAFTLTGQERSSLAITGSRLSRVCRSSLPHRSRSDLSCDGHHGRSERFTWDDSPVVAKRLCIRRQGTCSTLWRSRCIT
jgi:hypothetical protein